MQLNFLSISQARQLLDKGEITSLELTTACLEAISKHNSQLNACLAIDEAGALKAAKQADQKLQAGTRHPLLGIPYLAKDILMTKGLRTTAASKILADYVAPFDATVISKLKNQGAVLLGKTNLDEFAHGASTETSAFGPTCNPYDLSRTAGGSSGGSAAAVAAGFCLFALGSDTGGSIRQPASFCNLVGLKPTYGRVSRFGLISMTSSTDVIGPFTRTVTDAAIVLQAIAGHDAKDATSLKNAVDDYPAKLKKQTRKIKIGLSKQYFQSKGLDKGVAKIITQVADRLALRGAEVVAVDLPHIQYSVPVYYVITPSEISSNLARFDGIGWGLSAQKINNLKAAYLDSRGRGFGAESKRRIMLGTFALSAGYADKYYKKAQAVRQLIIQDHQQAFERVDVLLAPTSPHPAFKLGAQIDDPVTMYLEDIYLSGASLASLPAISVPAGMVETDGVKLPVGLQLIGPRLSEAKLLQLALSWEEDHDYFTLKPSLIK